ncbi:MAG: ABC transporter ATP-binding protein [Deltaproteobacteria bacterium]|jgi:ABC-2 type transport system ATP-binding protein|nr:ABC transporter ATP-binding protein [Deltaproteobacteria bacterium]MBT7204583.1 ABC transporter ATP-binding protein [Deltaproteobacteria bacterium]
MIEVIEISRNFGKFQAVNKVSFQVRKSEVLGFLGPNGAGKSTTMKMLTGYLQPSSGDALICGLSVTKQSIKARAQIGYLPESAPSYGEMQVEEFLRFAGKVRRLKGKRLNSQIEKVLEETSLKTVRNQLIETLSKGYRQRTCLAQALLHDPPVLLLDEPTDGLDPNQKHEVRKLINQLKEDRTILVSTHILEEVEAICSRAIILSEGKIVGDGTPKDLLSRSIYHNAINLKISAQSNQDVQQILLGIPSVDKVEIHGSNHQTLGFVILAKQGKPILEEVKELLDQNNVKIAEIYVEKGRLDEVFRQMTAMEAL